MKKFSEIIYKPLDFDEIQKGINEVAEKIRTATSEEAFFECIKIANELTEEVDSMVDYTYVKSLHDSTDKDAYEQMSYTIAGAEMVDTNEVTQAILDSPYRKAFDKKYGEFYLKSAEEKMRLSQAKKELSVRNAEICAKLHNLKGQMRYEYEGETISGPKMAELNNSTDPEIRKKSYRAYREAYVAQKDVIAPLIDELVHVRDELAKANGFDNFLEYANIEKDRFSYGEKELQEFCNLVKEKFLPLVLQVNTRLKERLGVEEYTANESDLNFADGAAKPVEDVKKLKELAQKMYDDLDPYIGDFFRTMNEYGYYDIDPSDNKVMNMALTTTIETEKMPFVFANYTGNESRFNSVFHEFGHAVQHKISMEQYDLSELYQLPQDMSEIPSKAMELLIFNYLDLFFEKDAMKYKESHLISMLKEIGDYCFFHEFETYLYTHVDATFEERVENYIRLKEEYTRGVDKVDEDLIKQGVGMLQSANVMGFPRYLISYSFNDITAVVIAEMYQKDKKKAMEVYKRLGQIGGSMDYFDAMKAIGIESAFTESAIDHAVEYFKRELELMEPNDYTSE